jgi:hypothetical protein
MARIFLTARWRNLAIITYPVAPSLLEPLLPPGCVLDLREGSAFVSLVAFDFLDTRVLGVRWPGFVRFPEVNLRFYVRCGGRRAVCFIRELVPRRLVAFLARTLYDEPYVSATMTSEVEGSEAGIEVTHRFVVGGREHRIAVAGANPPWLPPEDSVEHFFKEHDLGVGKTRRGRRLEYQVTHERWTIHPVQRFALDVDFGLVYGETWAPLGKATPCSVILAAGSPIVVYRPSVV